jgi:hypothetical protein
MDSIEVSAELPAGTILTPRAPFSVRVVEADGEVAVPADERRHSALPPIQPIQIKFQPKSAVVGLTLDVDFFYCRADRKGTCLAASKRYRLPIQASVGEKQRVMRLTARP